LQSSLDQFRRQPRQSATVRHPDDVRINLNAAYPENLQLPSCFASTRSLSSESASPFFFIVPILFLGGDRKELVNCKHF
jgi:hypothetical protein